jgi:hypothetical protein
MCKEMLAIPCNWVVDPKRIIRKIEGQGGREAQGVADPQKMFCLTNCHTTEKTEAVAQWAVAL